MSENLKVIKFNLKLTFSRRFIWHAPSNAVNLPRVRQKSSLQSPGKKAFRYMYVDRKTAVCIFLTALESVHLNIWIINCSLSIISKFDEDN